MLDVRHLLLRTIARVIRLCDRRSLSLTTRVRRVLVCAIGGLGNTILLLPLLEVLKKEFPDARIDLLLTSRVAAALAREVGWADEVFYVTESTVHSGLSPFRMFGGAVRRRKYDLVLRTFLTAAGVARTSLAAVLSGARVRVAFGDRRTPAFETHLIEPDESQPEVERHLTLARCLGLTAEPDWQVTKVPQRGRDWAADLLASRGHHALKPLLGIHPGSDPNYMAKRWPAEKFGQLASVAARKLGVRALILGGPDDGEAVARALGASDPGVLSAHGQDIIQTLGLIERCTAFVANDSGLMHLASALDIRTLAIFGPTDPVKNRPLRGGTVIHRLGLDCSPCSREIATFQCPHHDCLKTLGVDQVMTALTRVLDNGTDLREDRPGPARSSLVPSAAKSSS